MIKCAFSLFSESNRENTSRDFRKVRKKFTLETMQA